jgi:GT2 family glycosyltransferase
MSLSVSVVVPTFARADLLTRCVRALMRQGLPPDAYEILVADDGASARIQELVETLAVNAAPGLRVRYLAVSGKHGPAAARNCGWRAASAEVIAFTDDDTIPDPNWLAKGLDAMAHADAAVGWVSVPICRRPTDYELDAHGLEGAEFVTANCFVRKSVLEKIGGFDERFRRAWREDSDLYFTLLEHGQKVVWCPQARVLHPVRPAGWGVSLKQQRKIMFDALLFKKHRALYRSKIKPRPPWNYYANTVCLLALAAGMWFDLPLLASLGVAGWSGLSVAFCMRRLEQTSHAPRHVIEMLITSLAIPSVAVFWRLVGAVRFRVLFL